MLKAPLEVRQRLNRLGFSLACIIDEKIKKRVGEYETFELLEADSNVRYIVCLIDGKKHRINYKTKKEFVNENYYWAKHKFKKPTYNLVSAYKY